MPAYSRVIGGCYESSLGRRADDLGWLIPMLVGCMVRSDEDGIHSGSKMSPVAGCPDLGSAAHSHMLEGCSHWKMKQ